MAHVDQPKVVRARIHVRVELPNQIKHILVVETEMPIEAQDAGFDQEALGDLVQAVRAAMDRSGADEARIVRI